MRAVPVASLSPSVTVKSTRNVPGELGREVEGRRAADDRGRRRGVVEHAHRLERHRSRGAGHVRCDIHGDPAVDGVDDRERLHGELRLRRHAHEQRLLDDLTRGVGDRDDELDELLAAVAVVVVLVDDVAAGGRGDAADRRTGSRRRGAAADRPRDRPSPAARGRSRCRRAPLRARATGRGSARLRTTPARSSGRVRRDGERHGRRLGQQPALGRAVRDGVRERRRAGRARRDAHRETLTVVGDR